MYVERQGRRPTQVSLYSKASVLNTDARFVLDFSSFPRADNEDSDVVRPDDGNATMSTDMLSLDPASRHDPVLYRTGDAVSLDAQGRFAFHGRIDDLASALQEILQQVL